MLQDDLKRDTAYDVFISYSSKDKNVTDALCHYLEEKTIRCWMAPRDILPGQDYAEAIAQAMSKVKVFVLVYSNFSLSSQWVKKETNLAVSKEKIVIPFRIENCSFEGTAMELYLNDRHWIDAVPYPNKAFDALVAAVLSLLGPRPKPAEAVHADPPPVKKVENEPETPRSAPTAPEVKAPPSGRKSAVLSVFARKTFENAIELLYDQGDARSAYEKLKPIYQRFPQNEDVVAGFLAAAIRADPEEAGKLIAQDRADSLGFQLVCLDHDLMEHNLNAADERLQAALRSWPDNFLLGCRYVMCLKAMYDEFNDESFLHTAADVLASLPAPQNKLESSWLHKAKYTIARATGADSPELTREFCREHQLYYVLCQPEGDIRQSAGQTKASEPAPEKKETGSSSAPRSPRKKKAEPDRPAGEGEGRPTIESVVESFFKNKRDYDSNFFVAPSISWTKESNLRNTANIPGNARIFAISDHTVFGSAKNGLAFTSKGIYFHNDWTSAISGSFFCSWDDFIASPEKPHISRDHDYEVDIIPDIPSVNCCGGMDQEKLTSLLTALQEKLQQNMSDETSSGSSVPRSSQKKEGADAPPAEEGEGRQTIDSVIVSFFKKKRNYDSNLFVAPSIPAAKESNLRNTANIPGDARFFAISDHTVFGSAKNGLAFTSKGIYFHNDWSAGVSGSFFCSWDDFIASPEKPCFSKERDYEVDIIPDIPAVNCAGGMARGKLTLLLTELQEKLQQAAVQ